MTDRFLQGVTVATVILCAWAARAQPAAPVSRIVLSVAGLETSRGVVHCHLYDEAEGFPDEPDRAIDAVRVRPRNDRATCNFSNVKAGRYAVAVWHDVDGDGELDSNFLGIPQEPVGSSNDAKGWMGPPSFEDAAFDFRPPVFRQTITVE
jgi:uncharacterized protein (DUF2141 family)